MINNYELLNQLNTILTPEEYKDYCPNGMQVEGSDIINTIVTGVSLSEQLIDIAIKKSAEAIIVHHGIFWNKDSYVINGIKKRRIEKLIKNNINLYAYHLPLDNHPELGNNVQLANLLDFNITGQSRAQNLVWYGTLQKPIQINEFKAKIAHKLGRKPDIYTTTPEQIINSIAWCTGGADSFFTDAINLRVDAYLSGEASEPVYNMAIENGVSYIAAGHYATERYGIMALTEYLTKSTAVSAEFIELYNPI